MQYSIFIEMAQAETLILPRQTAKKEAKFALFWVNPNSQENLQFAIYLISVADIECPWLFHDIYWGKGHYNQTLSNKALLFEMGTHTIEKEYVLESAKSLAKVINSTLYKTTVDENKDLTINGEGKTVNESLENKATFNALVIIIPSVVVLDAIVASLIIYSRKKQK